MLARKKKLNSRTTMNFKGNSVLKKLMPSLELSRGGLSAAGRNITADHLSELNRISMSHKVILPFFKLRNTLLSKMKYSRFLVRLVI